MKIRGRKVVGGYAEGEALLSVDPFSFYGGVDPETGVVVESGHAIEGECITNKVFYFPSGKGSTVGSYVIYQMKKLGTAPTAILNMETEAIIVTGCVLADIPLLDRLEPDPIKTLKTGDSLFVKADEGLIETTRS